MENLMVFLLSFTFIFIIYLIIYLVKKHKGTLRFMKEFSLLASKYKLNRNNLDYNIFKYTNYISDWNSMHDG